eukprot:g19205.t1
MARCNGTQADLFYAQHHSESLFRQHVKEICAEGSESKIPSRLIVSYSRQGLGQTGLGQTGDGHFSPIAGYNGQRDLVLILDVARFKYPPHWVSVQSLFAAMLRQDLDAGMSRGWIRVCPSPLHLMSGPVGPDGKPPLTGYNGDGHNLGLTPLYAFCSPAPRMINWSDLKIVPLSAPTPFPAIPCPASAKNAADTTKTGKSGPDPAETETDAKITAAAIHANRELGQVLRAFLKCVPASLVQSVDTRTHRALHARKLRLSDRHLQVVNTIRRQLQATSVFQTLSELLHHRCRLELQPDLAKAVAACLDTEGGEDGVTAQTCCGLAPGPALLLTFIVYIAPASVWSTFPTAQRELINAATDPTLLPPEARLEIQALRRQFAEVDCCARSERSNNSPNSPSSPLQTLQSLQKGQPGLQQAAASSPTQAGSGPAVSSQAGSGPAVSSPLLSAASTAYASAMSASSACSFSTLTTTSPLHNGQKRRRLSSDCPDDTVQRQQ